MAKPSRIKAILGKIWAEFAPAVKQGSNELASAMYTGSAFSMPPKTDQKDSMDMIRAEAQAKELARDSRGREHGGRGM